LFFIRSRSEKSTMVEPIKLVIEGWRFIPHSYAMCTQHMELELLRRPEVQLFHSDLYYVDSTWRPDFRLFPPAELTKLQALPPRPAGLRPDAVLRMGWPFRFDPDPSGCLTLVWGTTERGCVSSEALAEPGPAAAILGRTRCRVIATSRWAADGFIASGLAPTQVSIVPAGVASDFMQPAPNLEVRRQLRRRFGWDESDFVLLNIGAMTGNKGIRHLLAAAGELLDRFPRLRIVLKGTDALYRSQELAKESAAEVPPSLLAKIDPRVMYTGANLTNEEMRSLYQAADLYVAPYAAEGFNMPVLESAACGLPVVCTAGGSTDDFIDGSWCRTIRSQACQSKDGKFLKLDQAHLVEVLEQTILDTAWRTQAAISGPEWVRHGYTWRHVIDRLLEVIRTYRQPPVEA
jgi:glycosyltransferase involved in cell wall biosynthesis